MIPSLRPKSPVSLVAARTAALLASRIGRRAWAGTGKASRAMLDRLEDRRLMARDDDLDPTDPGGGGGYEPVAQDDYEPNDSFNAATSLGYGNSGALSGLTVTATSTSINPDYFKFTASGNTTIQVKVNFSHAAGNLNLNVYNGSQQLLAHVDASSANRNYETFTFPVQSGQTYFLRVSGAQSPEYSIDYSPLSANFDWSMQNRFGGVDQYGLPVIPNTHDYAMPNPTWIDGVETPRFPVEFEVPGGITGAGIDYTWAINGSKYSTVSTGAGRLRTVDLPEGTYNVTLNVTANGVTVSTQQQVTVRNYLIVAIGDSYGSGEGNPHKAATYQEFWGYATAGAVWANSPDAQENIFHRMAHRSSKAGAAQAALAIENADPHTSVTFVFLNHTGATIGQGILNGQPSAEEAAAPGESPAQLAHLAQIIGGRTIDQMIMSVGGNDMGFATVLRDLVTNDDLVSNSAYENGISEILNTALGKIESLSNDGYPALAAALKQQFKIRNTILTEYPDISRNSAGGFADKIIDDVFDGLEVDRHEIERAMHEVMPKLVETMVRACRTFGWVYGGGLAAKYWNHGYGDWLRTARDSTIMQGPLDNINFLTFYSKQNTYGTMHPTGGGLEALRDVLLEKIYQPNLQIGGFNVAAGALTDGLATWSVTITNTSMLGTAATSSTALYMSPDKLVDKTDTFLTTVNIPALAPGQTVTLSGYIPTRADPFRTNANAVYIAPVADYANAVIESNEYDNALPPSMAQAVQSDRDLTVQPNGSLTINPTTIGLGQTLGARLGIDELIGGADFDFYAINVVAGQRLDIDIDAYGNLDTHVAIYSTMYDYLLTKIAENDNANAPGEPANGGESYLRHQFQYGGRYIIAVSHAANKNADPNLIAGRAAGQTGDYSIRLAEVQPATPPALVASSFDRDGNRVRFSFDEDVHTALWAGALELWNDTTGQRIAVEKTGYWYDATTNTANFTLPGYPSGLPDGNYRAVLRAGSVKDNEGTGNTADLTRAFHVMAGDIDGNRSVDFNDLLVLARNYGKSGQLFSTGNIDYSADGKVDFNDLLTLARQYGKKLAVPVAVSIAVSVAASTSTIEPSRSRARFSDLQI